MVANPRFMRLWQSLKEKQHEVWALCGAFSNPIRFSYGAYLMVPLRSWGILPNGWRAIFCRDQGPPLPPFLLTRLQTGKSGECLAHVWHLRHLGLPMFFFCFPSVFLLKLRGNFCPWPWHEFSLNYLKHVFFVYALCYATDHTNRFHALKPLIHFV